MVGNYFTHGPYNVTNMQIVRFNNSARSRTTVTYFLYSIGYNMLKNNINTLLEKLNVKRQG
jgi:hypothetical protein